ncbi:hypothetical protein [Priestia aryabhattai]|uniref:Uncharacterized protein n=1 Tax=Priestia aryabhattai TaxID=412384 RepID=A0ABD7X3T5_PRIAR|nr:hypothetical protein [Priestia aryabhattai]WEA47310.1 hypothetical protein PWO00_28455 [Priestia aryabhattai]
MQNTFIKEDIKAAALNELKKFIQHENIDVSTYTCPGGSIDIEALLQDHNINL